MTNFQQEAIRLAEMGYHLFPCLPGTKAPRTGRGVSVATCDLKQVERWWRECHDANIGLACHNCLIIDVDNKNGKNGDADFQRVVSELGPLPKSPTVLSGSGGWHYYFAKPEINLVGTNGVIWHGQTTGIDIQVGNQYVVVPPSMHSSQKAYQWIEPIVPVEDLPVLPQVWVEEFLVKRRKAGDRRLEFQNHSSLSTPDSSLIAKRCRRYVARMDPAIQGQCGSNVTLHVANVIFRGFALSKEQGWPVLLEYNRRCEPPWSEKELIHKMEDAIQSPIDKPYGWLLESKKKEVPMIVTPPPPKKTSVDPDGVAFPDDLLNVPGFVERIMQFCLKNCPYPSKPMAFCGAMALQSYLCSRKIKAECGIRPNLYLLAVGTSGVGKAFPRKINSHVLKLIGCSAAAGNMISSGQGLEDAMSANRKMIFQADEFDNILHTIANPKDSNETSLLAMLLQFYSEADETHVKRVRANGISRGEIHQPGLVIFGTATPESFFEALTPRLISNGFLSRSIILDAGERGRHQKGCKDADTLPEEYVEEARWWTEFNPAPLNPATGRKPNLDDENPTPYMIPMDEEGSKILDRLADHADDEYQEGVKAQDIVRYSVWTRAFENAMRLALVYACSRDRENPVIDREVATWAARFAEFLVQHMLWLVKRHVAENPFHKECIKILRTIGDAKNRQMSHSDALRAMKNLNSKQFREMMETLVEQGRLIVLPEGYPVGARGCSYQHAGD